MIFLKKQKLKTGTSIIETLFYMAIFVAFSIITINAMIVMMKSFKETSIQREIIQSSEIMERISREIKQADKINSIDTPDDLRLDSKDSNDVYKLVQFSFVNSNLRLLENNTFIANLNSPDIKVNNATFTQITTTHGKAVKIFLTVSSLNDSQARTFDFYDTVTIRGNY